jgi:hypothetical protein
MIPLWKGKNIIYFGVISLKVKVTVTINIISDNRLFDWITIIPFDNLYRRAYFVMHTFFVLIDL